MVFRAWRPGKPYNSVDNFFRRGLNSTTNINFSGGNDQFGYNVGYTKLNDQGFTPGNNLARDSYTLGGNGTLGKLKVNASINWIWVFLTLLSIL